MRRDTVMLGPNHAPNHKQDALLDQILAERAAIEARSAKLASRPSKDGDDK